MGKLRHLIISVLIIFTILPVAAVAQTNLTQLRDTIYNANGTPFNGTVTITWTGGSTSLSGVVSPLSTSARVYNGILSVLLVPTTAATAGTYYQSLFVSNDGLTMWTETWQVPVSSSSVTLSSVRISTTATSGGTTTGGGSTPIGTGGTNIPKYATLPIAMSDVTNLTSSLSSINSSLTTLTNTTNGLSGSVTSLNSQYTSLNNNVSGLNNTLNSLSGTVASLGSYYTTLNNSVTGITSTMNGLSSTVSGIGSTVTSQGSTLTALNTTVSGLNNTVTNLSGTVTNLGSSYTTLNNSVTGITSTVSGLSSTIGGINSTVTSQGSSLTALNTTVGTMGTSLATLNANVTALSSAVANRTMFVDGEMPSGNTNGTNVTFALSMQPSPASSLEIYRNGLVQTAGVDYNLSGLNITFFAASVPQTGDLIQAFYRTTGSQVISMPNFKDQELPAGSINGTNLSFVLAGTPSPASSLKLYKNGMLLRQTNDYSLTGNTIVFVPAAGPQPGDALTAWYRY